MSTTIIELDAQLVNRLKSERDFTDEQIQNLDDLKFFIDVLSENLEPANATVNDGKPYSLANKIKDAGRFKNNMERYQAAHDALVFHGLIFGTAQHKFRTVGRPMDIVIPKEDLPRLWVSYTLSLFDPSNNHSLNEFKRQILSKSWVASHNLSLSMGYDGIVKISQGAIVPADVLHKYINSQISREGIDDFVNENLADPTGKRMTQCPSCKVSFALF